MGGEMFDMGSEVKQLMFVAGVRMNSLNGKLAMRKRACLIEDHSIDLSQDIHIVGTLDEDTLTRSTTNTTKERKRHANNKSTGTRDNKEHQGPIQPCSEVTTKEHRQDGEGQGCENHDGRIDTGKTGDESLALRFALAGVLHKADDLRDGALAKSLRGTNKQDTREIDTARDDLVACIHIARQRLTCQGNGIQSGCSLDDDAIQRNFLTRTNHNNRADFDRLRRNDFPIFHVSDVGPDVHQMSDAITALTLGIALEEFANLEEEHDEDRLRKLRLSAWQETDTKGTDGGDRHEEMFIEHLALSNALPCFMERFVAY